MATILIVDDRAINRAFLATLLGFVGYDVIEAADGAEALEMVRAQQPALVISDVLMPTMDGVEFANLLHSDQAIAHIPVIFYTATYRLTEARVLAKSCGVSTVLAKPAEPQIILDAVAAALGVDSTVALASTAVGSQDENLPAHWRELVELQQRLQNALHEGLDLIGEGGGLRDVSHRLVSSYGTVQVLSLRLAALLELSLVLTSERDPQQLLKLFCRAAQDIMSARCALVRMGTDDRQPPRFEARGMTDEQANAVLGSLNTRAGLLRELLADGKPRQVHDLGSNPLEPGLAASPVRAHAFLLVPVMSRAGPCGWLYFSDKLGAGEFSDDDEQFAMTLAAQLAPVYENLALYEKIQQHASQLEHEIIERKHAAGKFRESELRFRQLAETIRQVFFLVDPQIRRVFYVSPAYEEIWGRSRESLYANPLSWGDVIHPDDRERALKRIAPRGRMVEFDVEYRIVRSDETMRWIWARGFQIRNVAGKVYRFACVAEDITERKQGEEKLVRYAARLQTLSARFAEVQEAERRNLAAELHDRIGQSLSTLGINLNIVSTQLFDKTGDMAARLGDSRQLVETMAETIRSVISELRPAVLEDYGLLAALRWGAEQFEKRTSITILVTGQEPAPRLPSAVEAAMFRMTQEVLTNAAKHAGAKHVGITLDAQGDGVSLTITDDGKGFDPELLFVSGRQSGWGLLMMRERIESVGGKVRIDSAPGCGTRIVVTWSRSK